MRSDSNGAVTQVSSVASNVPANLAGQHRMGSYGVSRKSIPLESSVWETLKNRDIGKGTL